MLWQLLDWEMLAASAYDPEKQIPHLRFRKTGDVYRYASEFEIQEVLRDRNSWRVRGNDGEQHIDKNDNRIMPCSPKPTVAVIPALPTR